MYIKLNGTVYPHIRRVEYRNYGNVAYLGQSLTGIEELPESIKLYREDGFLLREDRPGDFTRSLVQEGAILLTMAELPEAGTEPEPETVTAEELTAAIQEGVNSI